MYVEQSICPNTGKIIGYVLVDDDLQEVKIVTDFLTFLYNRNGTLNTIKAYAYDLIYYFAFLGKQKITYLEAPIVPRLGLDFFNHLSSTTLADNSINRIISAVQSLYTFLDTTGISKSVTYSKPYIGSLETYKGMLSFTKKKNTISTRYAKKKTPKLQPRPIKEDIVEQLLAAFKTDRDKAIFLIALEIGLRIGEILNLCFEDIQRNPEPQIEVRIREKDRRNLSIKNHSERIIDLEKNARFWQYYNAYIKHSRPESDSNYIFLSDKGKTKGQPLTYSGFRSIFKYWRKKLGIDDPKVTTHALRHTFATTMLDNGMSLEALKEIMGHASISTTYKYTKVSKAKRRRAYDKATNK